MNESHSLYHLLVVRSNKIPTNVTKLLLGFYKNGRIDFIPPHIKAVLWVGSQAPKSRIMNTSIRTDQEAGIQEREERIDVAECITINNQVIKPIWAFINRVDQLRWLNCEANLWWPFVFMLLWNSNFFENDHNVIEPFKECNTSIPPVKSLKGCLALWNWNSDLGWI